MRSNPFPGSNLRASTTPEDTLAFMDTIRVERQQRIADLIALAAAADFLPHMSHVAVKARAEADQLRSVL